MAEFIERKALREAFENANADVVEEYEDGTCDWGFGHQNILEVINSVPAADVAPVRRGRWIEPQRLYYGAKQYECSLCYSDIFWKKHSITDKYPHCPNCGCLMDGGNDE